MATPKKKAKPSASDDWLGPDPPDPVRKEPPGSLRPREERLLRLMADPDNPRTATQAAREAGFKSVSSIYRRLHPGGDLRERLEEILEQENASVRRAVRKLSDKLDAKNTKFFAHQGQVLDQRDLEAHDIQLEASKEILKLWDVYPRANQEDGAKGRGPVAMEIVFETEEQGGSKLDVKIVVDGETPMKGQADAP